MALVARNGLWLTRKGLLRDPFDAQAPLVPAMDYNGIVQAIAAGEMRFASSSNMQLYSSSSDVLLGAGGMSNVLSVTSNLIVINADVHIRGSIDTDGIEEMRIRDKVVRVGVPMNGMTTSDDLLDNSGFLLADTAPSSCNYEKSIRWNSRQGRSAVLAAGASNENFWELRGGHLRLTAEPRLAAEPGGERAVSYGFRMNEREELEIYKRSMEAGSERFQRVFTMGSAESGFSLPMSANPFYVAARDVESPTLQFAVRQPSTSARAHQDDQAASRPLSYVDLFAPAPRRHSFKSFSNDIPPEMLASIFHDARATVGSIAASNAFWHRYNRQ